MSTRTFVLMALALGFGLITSGVVYYQLTYTHVPPPREMASIVVAKHDLPARARTTAEDFDTRECPKDALPPQAVTRIEDAVERTARVPVRAGDPVLEVLLTEKGEDVIGNLIPDGMRAFAIRVVDSSTNVEGLIRPGSKVDICLSMRSHDQEDKDIDGGAIARTLLQNVEILAVGKQVEAGKERSSNERVRSVTVLVKPDQANELALAQNHGALHLTLRGKGEDTPHTARTDLRQLRGEEPRPSKGPVVNVFPQPPVAVAPPSPVPAVLPAPKTREVHVDLLHGSSRSSTRFSFPLDETAESSTKRD